MEHKKEPSQDQLPFGPLFFNYPAIQELDLESKIVPGPHFELVSVLTVLEVPRMQELVSESNTVPAPHFELLFDGIILKTNVTVSGKPNFGFGGMYDPSSMISNSLSGFQGSTNIIPSLITPEGISLPSK